MFILNVLYIYYISSLNIKYDKEKLSNILNTDY